VASTRDIGYVEPAGRILTVPAPKRPRRSRLSAGQPGRGDCRPADASRAGLRIESTIPAQARAWGPGEDRWRGSGGATRFNRHPVHGQTGTYFSRLYSQRPCSHRRALVRCTLRRDSRSPRSAASGATTRCDALHHARQRAAAPGRTLASAKPLPRATERGPRRVWWPCHAELRIRHRDPVPATVRIRRRRGPRRPAHRATSTVSRAFAALPAHVART
jgi:hypothetical protein